MAYVVINVNSYTTTNPISLIIYNTRSSLCIITETDTFTIKHTSEHQLGFLDV
jgi:hypothetical protein